MKNADIKKANDTLHGYDYGRFGINYSIYHLKYYHKYQY